MNEEQREKIEALFPPSVDVSYYRQMNPELQGWPDDVLREHACRYAKKSGKSTCAYDRREKMKEILNKIDWAKVLEIGPFINPMMKGKNIRYFDVLDSEGLCDRARELELPTQNIPVIDYVEKSGDLSVVHELFDLVVSCHAIEHTINFINHLQCVERILNGNGLYILFIPDKRFCFDHWRNETLFSEIIDADYKMSKQHSLRAIVETECMLSHNDPVRHWCGDHGSYELTKEALSKTMQKVRTETGYIDAHEWKFTPDSFGEIIETLNRLGYIHLNLFRLCHTLWGRFEFCAILQKTGV